MTTGTEQQLIDEYLARLERAARGLPADRRAELVGEIREHITSALAADGVPSGEAAVRDVLDRLGPPEEIVEAAADITDGGPPPGAASSSYGYGYGYAGGPPVGSGGPVTAKAPSLALEIWAVVMLTIGSILLPVIGWIVGVVLLWMSNRWRLGEKLIATLIVPGGWGGLLISVVLGGGVSSCFSTSTGSISSTDGSAGSVGTVTTTSGNCDSGTNWVGITIFALVSLATLLIPFVMLHLARKRAAAEVVAPISFAPVQGASVTGG